MIGWILYRKSADDLNWNHDHAVMRLLQSSEQQRIQLRVFRPEDLSFSLGAEGIAFFYLGIPISPPHFALPRRGASTTPACNLLMHALRASGALLINPPESIALAQDKLLSAIYLAKAGLPIPQTQWINSEDAMAYAKGAFSFPLIVKKSIGKRGSSVIKCPSSEFFEDTYHLLGLNNGPILAQDFIKSSHGRDLRVLVLGGKAVACMERQAPNGGYKANFSMGGSVTAFPLTKNLCTIAERAAVILGLDIAGIDLLFAEERDEFIICEANSSPGFKGLEQASGLNIAKSIIDFIVHKTQAHISQDDPEQY